MPRVAAWWCLRSFAAEGQDPLLGVEQAARERGLDERDRALARRLVGVEVRHRATLRAIVQALVPRRPKPDLVAHLHLGVAQLLWFDRIPVHAAVQATGAAAGETNGLSKSAPVREWLQRIAASLREGHAGDPRRDLVDAPYHFEEPVFPDPEEHAALWIESLFNIPAPLYKRWAKRYGAETALALAETFLSEPQVGVRGIGIDADALRAELAACDVEAGEGAHPSLLHVDPDAIGALTHSETFTAGRATVQGDAAFAAAQLLQAAEGERVLDVCCAPGGKSAVIAARGARVVATDVSPSRMARAVETWRRLHVDGSIRPVVTDGTRGLESTTFDAVLVDAPCSNTGVLGARPGARWRFGPKNQRSLVQLQERLLAEAAAHVRPGGRLVWSTCSLEPEENGRLVRAFLKEHPAFGLEDEIETLPVAPQGEVAPVDGGYAGRLRRGA